MIRMSVWLPVKGRNTANQIGWTFKWISILVPSVCLIVILHTQKRHSRSLLNYNILVLCLQTKSVDPLLFLCLKFLICMLSSQCKLKMFSLVLLFDLIISDTLVA